MNKRVGRGAFLSSFKHVLERFPKVTHQKWVYIQTEDRQIGCFCKDKLKSLLKQFEEVLYFHPPMQVQCLTFQQLSVDHLYEILRLRAEVFVVEQDCPYLDMDRLDQLALHLIMEDATDLVAYARILPADVAYPGYVSIGRVVSSPKARGTGTGKKLMALALEQCEKHFPGQPIKLSAQQYLVNFYRGFNFVETGPGYLEDGIPHIAMVRSQAESPDQ